MKASSESGLCAIVIFVAIPNPRSCHTPRGAANRPGANRERPGNGCVYTSAPMNSRLAAPLGLVLALSLSGDLLAQPAAPPASAPRSEDKFLGIATYRLWETDAPGAKGTDDLDVRTLTMFR